MQTDIQNAKLSNEDNLFNTAIVALTTISNPSSPCSSPKRVKKVRAKRDGHKIIPMKYEAIVSELDLATPVLSFGACQCNFCTSTVPQAPENATWKDVLHCTFKVMSVCYRKQYFSMKTEIVPFITYHWNKIWGEKDHPNWGPTVSMIMSKYTHIFKSGSNEMKTTGYWGLYHCDFDKIAQELKTFTYVQPKNKKRTKETTPTETRQQNVLSPPKKVFRPRDETAMLSVLASVAMEFPIPQLSAEELSMKLQEEVRKLRNDVTTLDSQIQQSKVEFVQDTHTSQMIAHTANLQKDLELLKKESKDFNVKVTNIVSGMVSHSIPLSV